MKHGRHCCVESTIWMGTGMAFRGTHVLIVEAWEQNAGVAVALWTEQPLMDAKTMRSGSRCGTSRTLRRPASDNSACGKPLPFAAESRASSTQNLVRSGPTRIPGRKSKRKSKSQRQPWEVRRATGKGREAFVQRTRRQPNNCPANPRVVGLGILTAMGVDIVAVPD